MYTSLCHKCLLFSFWHLLLTGPFHAAFTASLSFGLRGNVWCGKALHISHSALTNKNPDLIYSIPKARWCIVDFFYSVYYLTSKDDISFRFNCTWFAMLSSGCSHLWFWEWITNNCFQKWQEFSLPTSVSRWCRVPYWHSIPWEICKGMPLLLWIWRVCCHGNWIRESGLSYLLTFVPVWL